MMAELKTTADRRERWTQEISLNRGAFRLDDSDHANVVEDLNALLAENKRLREALEDLRDLELVCENPDVCAIPGDHYKCAFCTVNALVNAALPETPQ